MSVNLTGFSVRYGNEEDFTLCGHIHPSIKTAHKCALLARKLGKRKDVDIYEVVEIELRPQVDSNAGMTEEIVIQTLKEMIEDGDEISFDTVAESDTDADSKGSDTTG